MLPKIMVKKRNDCFANSSVNVGNVLFSGVFEDKETLFRIMCKYGKVILYFLEPSFQIKKYFLCFYISEIRWKYHMKLPVSYALMDLINAKENKEFIINLILQRFNIFL